MVLPVKLSELPVELGADAAEDQGGGRLSRFTRGRMPRRSTGMLFGMFGASLAAFAIGFDDCLFNLDTVDACVAHAESWVEPLRAIGDHIILWCIEIIKAVFN